MGLPNVRQGQFWRDRPRRDGRDLLSDVLHSGFALIDIAFFRPININSLDTLGKGSNNQNGNLRWYLP